MLSPVFPTTCPGCTVCPTWTCRERSTRWPYMAWLPSKSWITTLCGGEP